MGKRTRNRLEAFTHQKERVNKDEGRAQQMKGPVESDTHWRSVDETLAVGEGGGALNAS